LHEPVGSPISNSLRRATNIPATPTGLGQNPPPGIAPCSGQWVSSLSECSVTSHTPKPIASRPSSAGDVYRTSRADGTPVSYPHCTARESTRKHSLRSRVRRVDGCSLDLTETTHAMVSHA